MSAGSRTQVIYSEFSVDLNMSCFSAFKMTAKYEGHEGHWPSYCWITQVSCFQEIDVGRGDAV